MQVLRAQPAKLEWLRQISSPNYDQSNDLLIDKAGNLYLGGIYSGAMGTLVSVGETDCWIAKYNAEGMLLWMKTLGGLKEDFFFSMSLDSSEQHLLLAGTFQETCYFGTDSLVSLGASDIFLISMDTDGQWQWGRSYGGSFDQSVAHVAMDRQKRIYLTGYFEDSLRCSNLANPIIAKGIRGAYLLCLDSLGNGLWAESMGGALYDEGLKVVFDEHLNVYLSGYYRDKAFFGTDSLLSRGSYDCFLASWTSSGQWRWLKSFGSYYVDNCPALIYLPQNHQLVVGGWFFQQIYFDSISLAASGEEESFIASFDTLGQLQWAKRYGDSYAELIYDLASNEKGELMALGVFDSVLLAGNELLLTKHFNKPTDVFVLKIDPSNGQSLWGIRAGDKYNDFGKALVMGDSGVFYLTGNFQNRTVFETDTLWTMGNFDVFLARYRMDSTYTGLIRMIEKESPVKGYFSPNPANNYSHLHGIEDWKETYVLYVFDKNGRLLFQQKSPTLGVELLELPNGLYFVALLDELTAKVLQTSQLVLQH